MPFSKHRGGFVAALLVGIGLTSGWLATGGCQSGVSDDLLPSGEDPSSDTVATSEATTHETERRGGCAPNAIETITMASNQYWVLANRQKFIGLEAYKAGIEYDAFTFTIVQGPAHGQLLGTAPNVAYVPNSGYTGPDSFSYEAKKGCTTLRGTVSLTVGTTYVPPIGIPNPEFGINESHRMYASATFDFGFGLEPYRDAGNGPYTHYLNHQTGSDTNNLYGTAAFPRKTFPANLAPGSVVEVHGTGFDSTTRILIKGNGTADKPIFIRGANPLAKPILRRAVKIESDYVICENLEWDCRDFGTTSPDGVWLTFRERASPLRTFHHQCARHILMRDCPANSYGAAGILVDVSHVAGSPNNATDLTQHVVVYDIEVRNFGVWNDYAGTADYGGCLFAGNSRYGWLLDSHIHHIHGDATGMSRSNALSNQAPARNCYIGRNYVHHCKENGIDVKLCVDGIVSQNVVHTMRLSDSSNGDAVPIHNNDATVDWPYSDNIWILFNKIYDAEFGIKHLNASLDVLPAAADSRSYLIGNLIFDIRAIRGMPGVWGAAIWKGPRTQVRMINNTVFNCDQGIWVGLITPTEPERCVTTIRDNIVVNLKERNKTLNGLDAAHIFVKPDSILPYTTIDHNLHWEDVGAVRFHIVHPGLVDGYYYTIESLYAATGFGIGSMIADPQFVGEGSLDFHLQPGSPARNAGWPDAAFPTFTALFGLGINVHSDRTPQSTPPDVGPLGAQ